MLAFSRGSSGRVVALIAAGGLAACTSLLGDFRVGDDVNDGGAATTGAGEGAVATATGSDGNAGGGSTDAASSEGASGPSTDAASENVIADSSPEADATVSTIPADNAIHDSGDNWVLSSDGALIDSGVCTLLGPYDSDCDPIVTYCAFQSWGIVNDAPAGDEPDYVQTCAPGTYLTCVRDCPATWTGALGGATVTDAGIVCSLLALGNLACGDDYGIAVVGPSDAEADP